MDDFLKAGGTAKGMVDLMSEFNVEVVGTAFVMERAQQGRKLISKCQGPDDHGCDRRRRTDRETRPTGCEGGTTYEEMVCNAAVCASCACPCWPWPRMRSTNGTMILPDALAYPATWTVVSRENMEATMDEAAGLDDETLPLWRTC